MKVVLVRDIAKVGRRFDEVEVPDGYAANKLIPQGLAKPATAKNRQWAREEKKRRAASHDQSREVVIELLKQAAGKELKMQAKANAEGSLFQAIKPAQIALAVEKEFGLKVAPSCFLLEEPLKQIGRHKVAVVYEDVEGSLSLQVVAS